MVPLLKRLMSSRFSSEIWMNNVIYSKKILYLHPRTSYISICKVEGSNVISACSGKCISIVKSDIDVNEPFTSRVVSSKRTLVDEESLPFAYHMKKERS